MNTPRTIDLDKTFDNLVQWFYSRMVIQKGAPGFLVGLSGTDSLVTFCAAYKALEKAGKADRMMGVHFAPSEDFLYDHPEAEVHLWFRDQVLPWLTKYAPEAKIKVDTSIDWRYDGLRWGYLMDMSVVFDDRGRKIRLPEEQYWVVGTRNRTEDILQTYSNVSTCVSIQPIIQLWKSEVLQLAEHLGVPQIALKKSCETDCICGRMQIASQYVREIDEWLMVYLGEVASEDYLKDSVPSPLLFKIGMFINSQLIKNNFKMNIPYTPNSGPDCQMVVALPEDLIMSSFENGSLKLSEFNHYKHLYIAWHYLMFMDFESALTKYGQHLKVILDAADQLKRFNLDITRQYFVKIDEARKLHPTNTFDELVEKSPDVMSKISA